MSDQNKKTLIIVALVLLTILTIVFGIRPTITKIKDAKAENETLTARKTEMETEINNLPTYQANLKEAKKNYNDLADHVFKNMTVDEIHDEVVNNIVFDPLGLEINSLSIGNTSLSGITNYSVNDADRSAVTLTGLAKLVTVNIGVKGKNIDEMINAVDYFNTTEAIFMTSGFTYAPEVREKGEESTMSFSLYLVMSDKYDLDDAS